MTSLRSIMSCAAILLVSACSANRPSNAGADDAQIDAATAAGVLSDVESGKYGPRDDIGNTGVELGLLPEAANPETVFVLKATNRGASAATVEKIGLVQVGRQTTNMTVAGEELSHARIVNWILAPGETKALRLDLKELVFDGMKTADGTRPALEFLRAIPRDDRTITVVVWHRSPRWPSGVQEPVSYP